MVEIRNRELVLLKLPDISCEKRVEKSVHRVPPVLFCIYGRGFRACVDWGRSMLSTSMTNPPVIAPTCVSVIAPV